MNDFRLGPAMQCRIFFLLFLLLQTALVFAQSPLRLSLTSGMYRIDAEVVADQASRMQGLMNRRSMLPHQGMLFVFPQLTAHCMWMRNTYIPLSVAFLDEQGKIINIEDMQPHTEDNHCAARPARYALEMNLGWFSTKAIKPGSSIGGLEKAPQPR